MKRLFFLLRVFIGIIFILSGFSKLYPIEPFELALIEVGVSSWSLAPFISRFIISIEIFIGILLISHISHRFVLAIAGLLQIIFAARLLYLLVTEGGSASSGIFGEMIDLPLSLALVVSLVLLCSIYFLFKYHRSYKWKRWVIIIPFLVSFSLPYVLNTLYPIALDSETSNARLEINKLPEIIVNNTAVNFEKGEKIITFFSSGCVHCKRAAAMLSLLHKKEGITEIYFVMIGNPEKVDEFLNKAKTDFPFVVFNDPVFYELSGSSLPAIFYLKDGEAIKKWTGKTFTYNEIGKLIDYFNN